MKTSQTGEGGSTQFHISCSDILELNIIDFQACQTIYFLKILSLKGNYLCVKERSFVTQYMCIKIPG